MNSTLAQKVADAVVNGANPTALQKFGEAVVKDDGVVPHKKKLYIDSLIDGSGIVFE